METDIIIYEIQGAPCLLACGLTERGKETVAATTAEFIGECHDPSAQALPFTDIPANIFELLEIGEDGKLNNKIVMLGGENE